MQQQNKDKKKKKDERDLRTPPSLASGGIPDPTPAYQQLSALPPLALKEPRKLLVVIDLNGTLLHRPNKRHPSRFVERPHARQFLAYCIDVFHVVIWSSAKPANVASMCNQLLTGEQRSRVVAIWARDKFGLTPTDFVARTQCYKRLHVLWADPAVAASHPDAARGVRWSQQDTVLIDDSLEKARSERHNLVEIPEFVSSSDNDGAVATEVADILPQVHDYINECASQANVSAFIRERPFRALPTSQLLLGMASRPER
ncbi:HAD-like domain-containing protein [Microdochium trichocladiopsis]|uniref:Mitochondrial import inner membrane translocase subunit TIM50 n=1 Tax=Microdochium trichocladiopsis TaxID=1682393 RepID=A0A9P8Y8K2_9PEZI|nr:HAD-like domain-containing protein [Microdochium trichocladiopsis]KAH7032958.1 HAD-like domain-containing protein [Microdochium trichocladiopsis]